MKKVRHVLGISGGKDSAALAIYMKNNYPDLDIEYYTADTGKELDETYKLISNLEVYLGKKILRLSGASNSPELPFDHFLKMYGGYLPSSNARWCTKNLKLVPFEKFVGTDPVISYVGIRGDEDREGYISKKSNIQSIFPFRRNIWSEDVIAKVLSNNNIDSVIELFETVDVNNKTERYKEILKTPLTSSYNQQQKLNQLLDLGVKVEKGNRKGSLDSSIKSGTPNDFNSFFNRYPKIKYVFFNGAKAKECYIKFIELNCEHVFKVLPSSSSARAMSIDLKVQKWRIITEALNNR